METKKGIVAAVREYVNDDVIANTKIRVKGGRIRTLLQLWEGTGPKRYDLGHGREIQIQPEVIWIKWCGEWRYLGMSVDGKYRLAKLVRKSMYNFNWAIPVYPASFQHRSKIETIDLSAF